MFYNIIHDIVLKAHLDEKMARAASAAILVEQKAAETDPNSNNDSSTTRASQPHHAETTAATYNDGEVYLKGNPLKTTTEIRCARCGLPRLLHPTDGHGAKRPEPGVEYCKKRPFIDKPYHDVYGQTFVPEGPGRGKKKKDMINPLKQATKEGTPTGSQDSSNTSPPPKEGPAKPISFPHAKCQHCNTFLPIKRMNNHMVKCIGGGGRETSRAALWKIQNGNSNGSQNGLTPPGSRHSTPIPGGLNASKNKHSPSKRDAADDLDADESPYKKKKLLKTKPTLNPKTKLKAPLMTKSASQHSTSNLSFEQKAPQSEDEPSIDGDSGDGEYGSVIVDPKKKSKPAPVAKKIKEKEGERKKKWLHGKGGKVAQVLPPVVLSPAISEKIKTKKVNGAVNGHAVTNGKMSNGTSKSNSNSHRHDAASESSQTMSSPN